MRHERDAALDPFRSDIAPCFLGQNATRAAIRSAQPQYVTISVAGSAGQGQLDIAELRADARCRVFEPANKQPAVSGDPAIQSDAVDRIVTIVVISPSCTNAEARKPF